MPPKAFADLADMPEDHRITLMGRMLVANPGKLTAVLVDDEPGKAERYVEKLTSRFPGVNVEGREKGPTAGVVTLAFRYTRPS